MDLMDWIRKFHVLREKHLKELLDQITMTYMLPEYPWRKKKHPQTDELEKWNPSFSNGLIEPKHPPPTK